MPINPTDFTENKSATIQFSYPAVDNVIYDKTNSSFFVPNNNIAPNFSYTDATNNLYFSGALMKGYISSSNIQSSPELVLEHQAVSTNSKFYVVIPLSKTDKSSSSLNKLKAGSGVTIDLNSDIPKNKNIYHYLSTSNTHVFVFESPITLKSSSSFDGTNVSGVPTPQNSQKFKITSNTKVEDEIVCGYSEDDNSKKPSKKKTTKTTSYSIAMFLINIVIIMGSLHILNVYGQNIGAALFGLSLIFLVILGGLIYLYRTKLNYLIIFGSLGVTISLVCILSFASLFVPFQKWFSNIKPPQQTVNNFVPEKKSNGLNFLNLNSK